jgi:hypothetical protein
VTRRWVPDGACATASPCSLSALAPTPPPSGIRSFTWDGWKVSGDLRGSHDTYVAAKGSVRVRWRF